MFFRKLRSKKGFEMTTPVVISLIIGMIILAILIYLLLGKTKVFGSVASCPDEECSAKQACGAGYEEGIKLCTVEGSDGKEKTGRCCVAKG